MGVQHSNLPARLRKQGHEQPSNQFFGVIKGLNFTESDLGKLNVNGGAIALGHALGNLGTRLVIAMMNEMERRDAKRGLVSLCMGGGQGMAMMFER